MEGSRWEDTGSTSASTLIHDLSIYRSCERIHYLEVGFPLEVFEVFCWFRDQLVQVGCQMLRAEMFFPFNTVFVKLEFNSLKLMYNIPIEVIDMDE